MTVAGLSTDVKPRWLRDLARFLPLKSQFVLSGNVLDLQIYEVAPGTISTVPLQAAVARELYAAGYGDVLAADRVRGPIYLSKTGTPQPAAEALTRLGFENHGGSGIGLESLGRLIERVVLSTGAPTALVVDFASRLVVRSDSLSPDEHAFFSLAQLVSIMAKARARRPRRQTLLQHDCLDRRQGR